MRRPVPDLLCGLALATLLATSLPASAEQAPESLAPAGSEASCRVPPDGEPSPARPQADLGPLRARLAADADLARADGVRPLNTRGYNYGKADGGLDPAALGFEARGR